MSNLMLDVGQANELKMAFRRENFTNDDVKRLCEGDILSNIRKVLLGDAYFTEAERFINCDEEPFKPNGLRVVNHKKGGQLKWDSSRIMLHCSPTQKNGIEGNKLYKLLLANTTTLNANVLDGLLASSHHIPREWKGKNVFFWGTIYCDPDDGLDGLYVRYLYWRKDGGWNWGIRWLNSNFYSVDFAAVYM